MICQDLNSQINKIGCILVSVYFLIFVIILSYYIFGIYILADEYNLFKDLESNCGSKIWYYILFSLFGFADKLLTRKLESFDTYSNMYYLLFLIELILVIFGGIEIFNKKCVETYNLKNTKMYGFSIFNFITQIIVLSILSYKIIIMNKKKKISNDDNNVIRFTDYNENTTTNQTNSVYSNIYIDKNSDEYKLEYVYENQNTHQMISDI